MPDKSVAVEPPSIAHPWHDLSPGDEFPKSEWLWNKREREYQRARKRRELGAVLRKRNEEEPFTTAARRGNSRPLLSSLFFPFSTSRLSFPFSQLKKNARSSPVFNTVIEVPTGSKVKYRLCERTGVLRVEKVVGASLIFPFNYGFVPQTIAADEDALDVLVLMSEPVHPGSFLRAKPIGLMTMVMAAATPRGHTPRKGGGGDVEFGGFNTPRGGAEGEGAEAAGGAAADVKDPSSPMDEAVYAAADAQAAAARAASAAAPAGKIVPIARGDVSTATTPRIDTGDGRGLLSLTSADLGVAGVSDDKVIAVHADDPNFNSYNDIADLPPHRLQVS